MIKKLLKFGMLYVACVVFNNLVYMNHPEYQQRPADLPKYIANPQAYNWHPENLTSFQIIPQASAKELVHTSKRVVKTPVDINRPFIDEMAGIENPDGNPAVVNQFGYMGKFQMGTAAFRDIGVRMSPQRWKRHPMSEHIQDTMFLRFCALNSLYLEKDIKKYSGKRIKGIRIHEANILAAAHGGIGRAHQFLISGGRIDPKDGNGTRISHYFRKFEHHRLDLSKVAKPPVEL